MKKSRTKRISPTALTLAYFAKRNIPCQVSEKFIKAPALKGFGFRKDLFGGDLIALVGPDTINIQAGVTSDHKGKVDKALAHPEVRQWVSSPHRKFHVWTWRKELVGKRGRWIPKVSAITLEYGKMISRPFTLK